MQISFLTAWKDKKIPLVKKGIFGDALTAENISIKRIGKDSFVFVGDKKSGRLNDKDVVDYFLQFTKYPEYRKYIINTLRNLEGVREL